MTATRRTSPIQPPMCAAVPTPLQTKNQKRSLLRMPAFASPIPPAAAPVRVGGRDARDDDEVAVRTAVRAGLALPLEADLRAVLHAGLDLHRVVAKPALAARALALRARLLDHGAVAATARARLRER